MPTHFLLTTEVRRPEDLEYADFLLGPQAKATEALDLLLGTQGWRRFAEQDPAKFRAEGRRQGRGGTSAGDRSASPRRGRPTWPRRRSRRSSETPTPRRPTLKEQYEQAHGRGRGGDGRPRLRRPRGRAGRPTTTCCEQLRRVGDAAGRRRCCWSLRWSVLVLGLREQLAARGPLVRRRGRRRARCWSWRCRSTEPSRRSRGAGRGAAGHGRCRCRRAGAGVATAGRGRRRTLRRRRRRPRPALDDWQAARRCRDARAMPAMPHGDGTRRPPPPAAAPQAPADGRQAAQAASRPTMPPTRPTATATKGARRTRPAARRPTRDKRRSADEEAGAAPARTRRATREGRRSSPDPASTASGEAEARTRRPGRAAGRGRRRCWQQERGRPRQAELAAAGRQAPSSPASPPPWSSASTPTSTTPAATPELRTDFAETLYWHPVLVLPDGKAEVSFDLCDSVTTFQVTAFAHTLDGRLGAGDAADRVAAAVHAAAQDAHRGDRQRPDRRAR